MEIKNVARKQQFSKKLMDERNKVLFALPPLGLQKTNIGALLQRCRDTADVLQFLHERLVAFSHQQVVFILHGQ